MNHASYSERLDYLLELIEKGAASSPKQISKKFDCNEKTIRNMINVLRKQGNNIKYSQMQKKIFY